MTDEGQRPENDSTSGAALPKVKFTPQAAAKVSSLGLSSEPVEIVSQGECPHCQRPLQFSIGEEREDTIELLCKLCGGLLGYALNVELDDLPPDMREFVEELGKALEEAEGDG